jgi:hypothetical protein
LLVAESQLAIYQLRIGQKKARKPRFTHSFRVPWGDKLDLDVGDLSFGTASDYPKKSVVIEFDLQLP